jgi:DNA-binding IclR family transcriptional regulator
MMIELQITRQTASRYLDELVALGLLSKHKLGKENFYLNDALFDLLANVNPDKAAK